MKTLFAFLIALLVALPAHSQKVSAMPEVTSIGASDLVMITVPGVNNYKSTFLTLASNLQNFMVISAVATNAVYSGSNLAVTNATTFGVFYDVSSSTNMRFFSVKQGTNVILYRDGSNIVFNAPVKTNLSVYANGNELVFGNWGIVAGLSNAATTEFIWQVQDPAAGEDIEFGGIISAPTVNLTALPGSGPYLAVDGSGATFRTNAGAVAAPLSAIQYNSNGTMQGSSGLVYTNDRVGIGTTVPLMPLHIRSSVADTARMRVEEIGDTASTHYSGYGMYDAGTFKAGFFKQGDNHSLLLFDATAPRLTIFQGGDIGIATQTPTNRLDVNGHISVRSNLYLVNLPTNASPIAFLAVDASGQVFETATPSGGGGGDVTTAQLNNASNVLYSTETTRNAAVSNAVVSLLVANDTTTSNGLFSVETTRNAAVSNALASLLVANDTTTSNGLYSVETTRNAAVSNSLVTYVASSTQFVAVAIGTATVTNALNVGTLNANNMVLTNALTTNQVRLGVEDMTNSAAFAPQNGDLFSWHEGMKRWTNIVPQWMDVTTNITVSTVGNVLLDFAVANVFKLVLRTNLTYTFTNQSYLNRRAKVHFIQDLIGARTMTAYSVAGGILQTNTYENLQVNTNAAAMNLMEIEKAFWVTNLTVASWNTNFGPNIGPALLATFNDDFNRANDDPMTVNASDGVGIWTSGPGTYGDCYIDFNTLRGSTGGDNMARVLSPTFADNQSASVVLAGTSGNLLACGPAVRIKSTTDGDCYFAVATSTSVITVYSVVDDGASIIETPVSGGSYTGLSLAAGDRITLQISGTTLTVFTNSISIGTRSDATYSTGQPGIRMFNTTGGADSFSATDL